MDPESLLARARTGDQQAWNDLLAWCRPFVRAKLKRALPAHPEEASELTNDAQMKMHRGFPAFRGDAVRQFVAWAGLITERVLIDWLRRYSGKRRPPTPGPLHPDPLCPRPEVCDHLIEAENLRRLAGVLENLPEHCRKIIGVEDLVRLADALEKLPEHYRKVIEARLFDQLPPHVIADRLGWPKARVRVYSLRAVELLASQLRGKL
jgi:RNA polymerase sigma-70 factor (ECF subfamily)